MTRVKKRAPFRFTNWKHTLYTIAAIPVLVVLVPLAWVGHLAGMCVEWLIYTNERLAR